jgi:hypothetical protein
MTMASESTTNPDEMEDSTVESAEPESALETARRQLHHAADHLDIDQHIVERLKHPKKSTRSPSRSSATTVPSKSSLATVPITTAFEGHTREDCDIIPT